MKARTVSADHDVTVLLDGEKLTFDVPLQIMNKRVIVPAREIFESMGARVEWKNENAIMVAVKEAVTVAVRVDNEHMAVNGDFVLLEVAPRLIGGRMFVPLRAVAESLKAQVDWDGKTKTVRISNDSKHEEKTDVSTRDIKRIDDIWKIEDKRDFVIAMDEYISKKCDYGDKMEALNPEQRVFYITQSLEMEVNNGGFSQFFFNSSGMFANELVLAFETIGADKTAEICKRAISIYGESVPADRDEREDIFTEEDEKIESILNECDDSFFDYEDDLLELNYQYIVSNKNSFSK